MEDFLKDDEFAQYVINDYFADYDVSNEEKLAAMFSSMHEFNKALECFKLSDNSILKH